MALKVDAVSSGTQSGGTLQFAHTCSGRNRILIVAGATPNAGSDRWTGVTYNGVAMTRIATVTNVNNDIRGYAYYLVNPTLGTHNIVVSTSGDIDYASAISYKGAKQTSQPNGHHEAEANNGTELTTTITTTVDNCWNISFIAGGTGSFVASTGVNSVRVGAMGDSNGPKSPAGAYAMRWTCPAQKLVALQVAIAPGGPSDDNGGFLFGIM